MTYLPLLCIRPNVALEARDHALVCVVGHQPHHLHAPLDLHSGNTHGTLMAGQDGPLYGRPTISLTRSSKGRDCFTSNSIPQTALYSLGLWLTAKALLIWHICAIQMPNRRVTATWRVAG